MKRCNHTHVALRSDKQVVLYNLGLWPVRCFRCDLLREPFIPEPPEFKAPAPSYMPVAHHRGLRRILAQMNRLWTWASKSSVQSPRPQKSQAFQPENRLAKSLKRNASIQLCGLGIAGQNAGIPG